MTKFLKFLAILIPVLVISGCSGNRQSMDIVKFLDTEQSKDSEEDKENDSLPDEKEMEESREEPEEEPGEAVIASDVIGADYFASAKLAREQTRAKNIEILMDIINNKSIDSADKKSAKRQIANIKKNSEKENAAETMLNAKGYENATVSINDGNADVVISAEGLTEQDIEQIENIVKRKTGIEADRIVITPVKIN